MKKIIPLILCVILIASILPFSLVACNDSDKIVYLLNWGDYLDKEVKDEFRERTGITIRETIVSSNEEMLERLEREDCKFDLCIPSDYAVERLIKGGWLTELNFDNIPNFKNIDEYYLDLPYDRGNRYSIPYFWGVMGILYNKTMVDEADLGSWDVLWNEKYEGKIYMYNNIRDTLAVGLGYCGYSINSTDPDELDEAADALIAQKPLVKGWGTDDNKDNMIEGLGVLAMLYNGDAMWCIDPEDGNPDLGFFFPKGSNFFIDNFTIPKNAEHKKNAEKFINYLLEPEVAVKNIETVGYSTPNKEALALLGEEWTSNPIFNIPKEQLDTLEIQRDIGDAIELYEREWTRINIR